MDPWRDYPNFTEGALDAFIKRFPSHPDHAAAVAELERRRKVRDQRAEARSHQTELISVGKGFLTWTVVGIAILALAVLFLALPIFTPRTQRARRPTALPASFRESATPSPQPSATNTRSPRSEEQ